MYSPQNATATADPYTESLVLALLIFDQNIVDRIRGLISMDDFSTDIHKKIFDYIETITSITDVQKPQREYVLNRQAIILAIEEDLNLHPALARTIPNLSVDYIDLLLINISDGSLIFDFVNILNEKRKLRFIRSTLESYVHKLNSQTPLPMHETSAHFVYELDKTLNQIYLGTDDNDFEQIGALSIEYMNNLQNRIGKNDLPGISSGFKDLDYITDGWKNGELIILAARPSMGKTALSLNFAMHASSNKKRVLYVSLEMTKDQLTERITSSMAKIDGKILKNPNNLRAEDQNRLLAVQHTLQGIDLSISNTSDRSLSGIISKIKRAANDRKVDMIVIDYLQLMIVKMTAGGGDNRQIEVTKISNQLKALALELDVPIIALAQLNRTVEQRQDKRPMMSDLRDSGSIEQDADIIMMLYRDDYYHRNKNNGEDSDVAVNQASESGTSIVEVSITKNRSGATGTATLFFDRRYSKFANATQTTGAK